jgi:hypothetical protein
MTGPVAGWGNNAAQGRAAVFDGDRNTMYDAPTGGVGGAIGLAFAEPHILTEVRVHPRMNTTQGNRDRINNSVVQGSNDGENWTDVLILSGIAPVQEQWYTFTADQMTNNTGWLQFRYFSPSHTNLTDLEFWGNPGGGYDIQPPEVTLPHSFILPIYDYTHSRTWTEYNSDFTQMAAWDAWLTPEAAAVEAQFNNEWTTQPYALLRSDSAQIVVNLADRGTVRNLIHFANLDQVLGFYNHFHSVFDFWAGLDPLHQADNHYVYWADMDWDNVDPRHVAPNTSVLTTPSTPGAGAGYWAGTHMGQAGGRVNAYLYRSWLALHELGHGYQGTHFRGGGTMPMGEAWNNVYSHFYQARYILPLQPLFPGGQVVGSWAVDQAYTELNRALVEANVFQRLTVQGGSYVNWRGNLTETNFQNDLGRVDEWRLRLWFFIPVFEAIGMDEGFRDFNRLYREMFAVNAEGIRSWRNEDVHALLYSRVSGYNLVPWFDFWGLQVSPFVQEQVAHLPALVPLALHVECTCAGRFIPHPSGGAAVVPTGVPCTCERGRIVGEHGLASEFALIPAYIINPLPPVVEVAVANPESFVGIERTSGDNWLLSFTVTETMSDGTIEIVEYSISIESNNANASGVYVFAADHALAGFMLVFDLQGNGTRAVTLRLIQMAPGPNVWPIVDAVTAPEHFILIAETAHNSREWVLAFAVEETYFWGGDVVTYVVTVFANNANVRGSYVFDAGHALEGFILEYDIRGNGSNIERLRLVRN